MSNAISSKTNHFIANRAGYRCEYCRIHQDDSNFYFHFEHIISKKHGGTDDPDNLAFSRSRCNRKKGSDIGTVLEKDGNSRLPVNSILREALRKITRTPS